MSDSSPPMHDRFRWHWTLALLVLLALPYTLVDVPPVLDYPNHLARFFVLAHPSDPVLAQFYAPHWRLIPNLGFDLIGTAILKILPLHVGGRLLLAISEVAPVLGVLAYSRAAFGRLTPWPVMTGLAAWNAIFFLGFLNFLLSVGLGFAAAALWMVLRRRGAIAAMLFAMAASAVLFLCHIFGVLLFALLIFAQEISRLWDLRRRQALRGEEAGRVVAMLLLALLPAAILYGLSPLSSGPAGLGRWYGIYKVWEAFAPFMTYSKPLTLLTGLAVFCFLVMGWRDARFAPGTKIALTLLALLFVVTPDHIKGGTFMDLRLALLFGLLLFAGIDPRFAGRFGRIALTAFVALLLVRSVSVGIVWFEHRQDLADLRAAMAPVSPGARVLLARGAAPESVPGRILPGVYPLDNHLPALLLIERRAFWPLLFADPSQQPLMVRPPYDAIAHPLGEPADWAWLQAPVTPQILAQAPYLKAWRTMFDYVLLIDPPEPSGTAAGLVPVRSNGYAALYRVSR